MFNNYLKFLLLIIFINTIIFFSNGIALAAGTGNLGSDTANKLQQQMDAAGKSGYGTTPAPNALAQTVAGVIKVFLSLLGVIFVVYIIYAGYTWMTAQGEEEKVNKAKDTLQRAIIGLIIIISAYSITYFVFSRLPGGGSGGPTGSPGKCPYIYSWDGRKYIKDTTIIYKLDNKEKEAIQLRKLNYIINDGVMKIKIVEEEKELSFIDKIELVIIDKKQNQSSRYELNPIFVSRDLDKILNSDNQYLITKQGEEVLLEFGNAPTLKSGWVRQIYIQAEGYYESL